MATTDFTVDDLVAILAARLRNGGVTHQADELIGIVRPFVEDFCVLSPLPPADIPQPIAAMILAYTEAVLKTGAYPHVRDTLLAIKGLIDMEEAQLAAPVAARVDSPVWRPGTQPQPN